MRDGLVDVVEGELGDLEPSEVEQAGSGQFDDAGVGPCRTKGTLRFDYATFQANENPELRLTIYTPVDPAASR